MTQVNRGHLAGLLLALDLADTVTTDSIGISELQTLIAQASAAPEQEAVAVAIYSDAVVDEVVRTKSFALVVGDEGVSHHLQLRVPGVQDVTIAYTHADEGELERLRALSVTNIMLEVVPGWDGMGEEAYAKSVADVEAAFGKMVDREELLEQKLAEAQALLSRVINSGALTCEQYSDLETDICAAAEVVAVLKRMDFKEHLSKCVEEVAAMPAYKRDCLKSPAFLSATAQPAECQHRYMHFGTQPARRCADCSKVEPADGVKP